MHPCQRRHIHVPPALRSTLCSSFSASSPPPFVFIHHHYTVVLKFTISHPFPKKKVQSLPYNPDTSFKLTLFPTQLINFLFFMIPLRFFLPPTTFLFTSSISYPVRKHAQTDLHDPHLTIWHYVSLISFDPPHVTPSPLPPPHHHQRTCIALP